MKTGDGPAGGSERERAELAGAPEGFDWGAVVDSISTLIFVHDAEYRLVDANLAYVQRAGGDLSSLLGRPYWEAFPRRNGPLPGCQRALESALQMRECSVTGGGASCSEAVEEFTLSSGESFVSRSFPLCSRDGRYSYSIHIVEDITAQRKAEQNRWNAEAKMWAFTSAARDAILVTDDHEQVVFCNPAGERLLEYSVDELYGRSFSDLLSDRREPEDGDLGEAVICQRSGGRIPVEVSLAPLSLGGRRHQVRILRDIRDRKEAARLLRERETQLDYLLANTTEGILVVDPEGCVLYANSTAGELFGRSAPRLLGQTFGFPVVSETPQEIWLQTPQQGQRTVEMRVREVRWNSQPAWLLNLHDITERKRVETELRQAAIVFEESGEGILITDVELRVVAANQAFTKITGLEESEILGHTPRRLATEGGDASFYPAMQVSLTEHGHWSGEIHNRRRGGGDYSAVMTVRAVCDEQGVRSHYLVVFSDISKVKEYQVQLEQMMHSDPLTGLPNRLLFHDRLEQALAVSRRSQQPLAVLVIDLVDFKAVNDSLGHSVGDQVLEQIGYRLSEAMRSEDTVARLGGDEFGILMPELPALEEAASIAETLLARIERPFTIAGREIPIATRAGLSVYPGRAKNAAELLQQADSAMYQAKHEGVSYRFFSQELTEQARERVQLGAELRQALDEEILEVHYQPQVDLIDGKWTGLEALVRWHHPERGWISPARFIPIAERSGLIVRLGDWVLEQACAQYRKWLDAGYDFGRLGVNFAALQLVAGDLVEKTLSALERTGLPPSRLEIEVTEGVLVNPDQATIERLQTLRAHGVSVAIDDFGTGYSALSYLKDLPVDCLKIDRSFVDGLPDDAHVTAISRAINALGQSLGFSVIAEGIETERQRQALLSEGCLRGQGFFFARPNAPSALIEQYDQKNGAGSAQC